jgi:hypothetical protein
MADKSFYNRFLSVVVAGASLCVVSGCGPRGESHTVDQILADARSGFQQVSTAATGDAAGSLKNLASALDKLAGLGGGGDAKAVSSDVANTLTGLSGKVGYTVRPALAELVSQYRTVAEDSASASIGAPNLKLLVARTYSLMASELTTTQFKIS